MAPCYKPPVIYGIIGVALALASGVTLVLVSCLVWMEWWPSLVVVAFLLAPLPNLFFSQCGQDEFSLSEKSRIWQDVGHFLTGFILAGGLGIPIVLTHVGEINTTQFFLSLGGGAIIYAAVISYIYFFHNSEEEEEEF